MNRQFVSPFCLVVVCAILLSSCGGSSTFRPLSKIAYPAKPEGESIKEIADPPQQRYTILGFLAAGSPAIGVGARIDTAALHEEIRGRAAAIGADGYVIRWIGTQDYQDVNFKSRTVAGMHALAIRYQQPNDPTNEQWYTAGTSVTTVMDPLDESKLEEGMIPKRVLRGLQVGMTKEKVRILLGEPEDIREATNEDRERWDYEVKSPDYFAYPYKTDLAIYFNPDGTVSSVNRNMWRWR